MTDIIEIQIGEAHDNSWITIDYCKDYKKFKDLHNYISVGSTSYLIHLEEDMIELKIAYDTTEAEYLKKLLDKDSVIDINKIINYLIGLAIMNLTVQQFKDLLQNQYDNGYLDGQQHKIKEIKTVLQIY